MSACDSRVKSQQKVQSERLIEQLNVTAMCMCVCTCDIAMLRAFRTRRAERRKSERLGWRWRALRQGDSQRPRRTGVVLKGRRQHLCVFVRPSLPGVGGVRSLAVSGIVHLGACHYVLTTQSGERTVVAATYHPWIRTELDNNVAGRSVVVSGVVGGLRGGK